MRMGDSTPTDDPSFEKILERLKGVVSELEEGDLPLEKSLEVFEEGVHLSRLGAKRLDDAETRVEQLLSNEDGVSTRPMDEKEQE